MSNKITENTIGEFAIDRLERLGYEYIYAPDIADGLLINFGSQSLDFKRVYNKNLVHPTINKNLIQDK